MVTIKERRDNKRTLVGRLELSGGRKVQGGIYSDSECIISVECREDVKIGERYFARYNGEHLPVTAEHRQRRREGSVYLVFTQTPGTEQAKTYSQ